MISPYTEQTLVAAIQQGDPKAIRQLYNCYYKALLGAITQIVRDPIEAQDLLQDTYVKVWQRFHYYDPGQGRLFTWLLQVARNTALDFVRRPKPIFLELAAELDASLGIVSHWPMLDTLNMRQVVTQQLKPQQWQVIELFYWQGYTHEQIADQLTLPLGTVKSRIRQSLLQLQPLFT